MKIKETILKGVAKASEQAVKEACGSKSLVIFFEPEMPKQLKARKANK